MATLRWLLLTLLTFTVPVMGLAAVLPPDACPMQSQEDFSSKPNHGCCNDSADQHSDRSSAACKPGQACSSNGVSSMPAISIRLPIIPPTSVIVATYDHGEIARTPASVWRPPRV